MKWLNRELADSLSDVIKKNYNHATGSCGIISPIVIDGKTYMIKFFRNTGVHYNFDVMDGLEKIATGDFPATKVAEEYRVIRFYSGEKVIFEYKLGECK